MSQHVARAIAFTGPTAYATRFVYPPTLTWDGKRTGAARYEVLIANGAGVVRREPTDQPRVDLTQMWEQLPYGPLDVMVLGLGPDGTETCLAGHRRFAKAPGFDGVAQAPLDWADAVRRNMAYLLAPARDEVRPYERGLPRCAWSSFEDSITGQRSHVSFPALHAPSYIMGFLRFADAFPDDRLAAEARHQADRYGEWLLTHRHPADWTCALFPYSTLEHGQVGGVVEGTAITLVRAARVGEAMMELNRATGEPRYLDYAWHLARRLRDLQRPDGSWPYRVQPRTGEVVEEYTSNAIAPVRLFELLEEIELDASLTAARERAVEWILAGPVRDGLWQGMYEDVSERLPYENLQHWDTNDTITYLLRRRPDLLAVTKELNRYIEDQFVVWQPRDPVVDVRCPTPAVLEQYVCYKPIEAHAGRWLVTLTALHEATGEGGYLDKAVATANAIVRTQQPGGAFSTWGFDERFGRPLLTLDWPGCNAEAVIGLLRMIDQKATTGAAT
ncbi:hypothetical protein ONA91_31140 [Micromonospora sp. DR5-3]|uniref:hypothetical protein n=1 Tax=unclassified Micromonospora TaxID=2617518 RepID=UPI002105C382|nr:MULTISPECIES: hypothetical protein [unclassified Micromonospora]MCW3818904.1 hypothetical protein [Micromonospora sp. DR5-3]